MNGIAEIDGTAKTVLEEFSSRRPRERWQLEREAVVESRPAKAHGVDATALHDQWHTQVEALGLEPITVVDEAIWPG